MKRTVIPTIVTGAIVALLAVASFRPVNPATENEHQLLARANEFNMLFPQEKVYLHLDRPSYWAGEDIWFKGYLKGSPIPATNLYVELLDSKGIVIYRNICRVKNALTFGDIHLADTISQGTYQLRAYTNWMRNFDEQHFFRGDLVIWNIRNNAKKTDKYELKAGGIDVQFLPEGGTFLQGVKNRLAFKVADNNGVGLKAEGVVLDENKNEIVRIKTGFGGMGSFWITPEEGKTYNAEMIASAGLPAKVDLPKAEALGVAIQVYSRDTGKIQMDICTKGFPSEQRFVVIGQNEGNVCYQGEVFTSGGKGSIDISKKKLPTGITRLTLFDSQMVPRCERLVFVNHHDQTDIKIEPVQSTYKKRQKVQFDLYSSAKDGNPITANLSVSVFHLQTTGQLSNYPENILTSFLISSELKGRIENPGYYFKDDSLSTLSALDNLMMTHGYRYFSWKEVIENRKPEFKWETEPSIQFKGRIYSSIFRRSVPLGKLTLFPVNSQMAPREEIADSSGHFVFSNLLFYDTLQIVVQSAAENGRKNAEIEVDKSTYTSPKANILPLGYRYSEVGLSNTAFFATDYTPSVSDQRWHLNDTILLRDVKILARRKKTVEGYSRPKYGPDQVIYFSKLDRFYGNVVSTIEMNSPLGRKLAPVAHFYFNGFPDVFGSISDIPVDWVDRAEIVKSMVVPGVGHSPAIYVYAKKNLPDELIGETLGILQTELVGYTVTRNFYTPVYEGTKEKRRTSNDFRSTLFWNPVIQTDDDGSALIEFFNSDQTGEVQVVVEGVSKDGKLCRGEYRYSVTK